ncbi:MAG TPA: ABC transporter ATP-binding protein [Candidatus Ozemobacteraceae bacterium]|nr:ABC transporter ATP-binding protein [Candidatus Ozemobacteraceae bacterium]
MTSVSSPVSPRTRPTTVEVDRLTRTFGSFTAVDQISFAVNQGEVFGFLGPNGAGKSTTIRMLCGLLLPTAGTGRVGGFDVHTESERIKENIGYMSQRFSLYEDLTIDENIRFYADIYNVPYERLAARIDWVYDLTHLSDRRHRLTGVLPLGLKQRLALGCAVIHEPPILFLDEPTSGVDPISRRSFWELIYQLAHQGTTVFVTTHYMDEAEHCDRLAMIYRGRLVAIGTPEEMRATAIGGSLLRIEADPLMDALEVLEHEPSVLDVAVFGASLHVRVTDPASAAHAVKQRLANTGIRLETLEPVRPSLEDVFVSLVEQADDAAQPASEAVNP